MVSQTQQLSETHSGRVRMGRSDTKSLIQSILIMGGNNDFSLAEIVEDGFEIREVIGSCIIESICNWIFVSKSVRKTSFFDYVCSSY